MAISTYKERVEGYTGTITDTTLLNAWLNEAAQWVVSILPQELLSNYAVSVTYPVTGFSITAKRVINAIRDGYPARRASEWEYQRASVSTSLYKADATDPLYIIRGGKLLMLPSAGTGLVYYLEPPALSYNDTSLVTLPHQADNLIVLWTAVQVLLKNLQGRVGVMQSISTDISGVLPASPSPPSFTILDSLASQIAVTTIGVYPTLPVFAAPIVSFTAVPAALDMSSITPPTPPNAPTITYSDATAGSISQTTIGALPSAPIYVPPTAIDFSSLPLPDAVTVSANVPIPPSPPTFTYTDAVAAALVGITIAPFPTAPTYTKPTASFTAAPAAPDFSSITLSVTEPGAPSFVYDQAIKPIIGEIGLSALPDAPVFVPVSGLNFSGMDFPADLDTSGVTMPTAPAPPVFAYTPATTTNVIQQTFDEQGLGNGPAFSWTPPTAPTIQISGVPPQPPANPNFTWTDASITAIVEAFLLDLSTEFAKLTDGTTGYIDGIEDIELALAKVQEIQARIARFQAESQAQLQKLLADAQNRNDMAKFNALNTYQDQVQEYNALLQAYSTQMQGYSTQIQADVQKALAENQIYMQESKNGLDNALAEFNEANAVYQARLQGYLGNLQVASQKALQDAASTNTAALQNQAQELQRQIQEYSAKVQLYQSDVQAYGIKINALVAEHRQNIDAVTAERNAEIARYQGEMQGAIAKLNGEVQLYQAQAQVIIAEAQVELDRIRSEAQLQTNVDLQNALQYLGKQVQEYQAKVSRYSSALQQYQFDISKEAQEYNLSLERIRQMNAVESDTYQKDLYNELNEFNAQMQVYTLDTQKILAQAQISSQEVLQKAQMDTQVDLENRLRQFNVQVQQYAQSIATFGAQVQAYQADVASQVQIGAQNLSRIIEARRSEIERFSAGVINARNAFEADLAAYQANVNKVMQQAQLDQQRLITQAQIDTEVNVANEAKTLEALIADYVQELALYQSQLQEYQYKVGKATSEYQSNLERVRVANQAELSKYQADIQSATTAFNGQLEEYRALVQKELQQAEMTQARLIEQARLDLQANLDTRTRQLNAAIAEYSAQLDLYRTLIQGYATDVQRMVSQVQATIGKETLVTQTILQQIGQTRAELQQMLQIVAPGIQKEAV